MIAEIICVGTEILMGQILNTNAKYISQRLVDIGISLYHQTTVGDNNDRLTEEIKLALSRSEILILTGGLGPTSDDLTKETVAKLYSLPLERHQESFEILEKRFKAMRRDMTPNNLKQADFPRGAIILPNPNGTAPGCIVETQDNKKIILLPGPPRELVPMFEQSVVPYLQAKTSAHMYTKVLHIFGLGESAVEYQLRDLIKQQTNPTIAPYAATGEMTLRITAGCRDNEEGERIIRPVIDEIRGRLGDVVYSSEDESMHEVCAKMLRAQKKTLAVAESCTGGMLASMLVGIPGCSDWFVEGAVTYSNDAKIRRLVVKPETLKEHGAVSEETAKEMAAGMQRSSGADIALAITGFAGPPKNNDDEPVGLVYIALADRNGVFAYEYHQTGDRERIRSISALKALDILRKYLLKNK